jgi:hypothetical protein
MDWRKWIIRETMKSVKMDASPGYPFVGIGKTNEEVLEKASEDVICAVLQRMDLLCKVSTMMSLTGLTAEELVQLNYCDPVKLFVKSEPHSLKKIQQKRWRLIMSVSLVDQIVERLLSTTQNKAEIAVWEELPSACGSGLSDYSIAKIWELYGSRHAAETDISGWDWSVPGWLMDMEAEARIRLIENQNHPGFQDFSNAMRARTYCETLCVFVLSDTGELVAQRIRGKRCSGSFNTSSGNSRMRFMLAILVGASWAVCMGDDAVEEFVEGAESKYDDYGFITKMYTERLPGQGFEFCSTWFKDGVGYPMQWGRTLYRLLSKPKCFEFYLQFVFEMRHLPNLQQVVDFLVHTGYATQEEISQWNDDLGLTALTPQFLVPLFKHIQCNDEGLVALPAA